MSLTLNLFKLIIAIGVFAFFIKQESDDRDVELILLKPNLNCAQFKASFELVKFNLILAQRTAWLS